MSMTPAASRVRRDVEEMAQGDPVWQLWITLTELVDESSRDPVWAGANLDLTVHPPNTPQLSSATATVEHDVVKDWYRKLFAVASSSGSGTGSLGRLTNKPAFDPLDMLESAINQNVEQIRRHATELDVDPDLFATLADLAARPLLLMWSRILSEDISTPWPSGYCPVCGGWPAIAELRGLDRTRWLRCMRCASEWRFAALHCPYCGTTDHKRLGSLATPDEAESRRVDVCNHCHGYVKTLATLRPLSSYDITLVDVGTVDLDVAALDRGYARPSSLATQLNFQVVAGGE